MVKSSGEKSKLCNIPVYRKIEKSHMLSLSLTLLLPPPHGKRKKLIEIQTSMSIEWHVGPQPNLFSGRILFAPLLIPSIPIVSGKGKTFSPTYGFSPSFFICLLSC
jgi:hypothetical protein